MQDIKRILENPDKFKELVQQKNINLDIDSLISTYRLKIELQQKVDDLREQRNNNTNQIKQTQGKPPAELIARGKELKEQIAKEEEELNKVSRDYQKMIYTAPQMVSTDTPVGPDESGNVEIKTWSPEDGDGGKPIEFDFKFKDHIELGTDLNIIDLERGVKTSGFRGYYLKNEGALMHMALMMYGLRLMQSKGFQTFVPPTVVKDDALWGSGHFPFDEENVYMVDSMKNMEKDEDEKEKKYLIGTSEPSILNYHRDEILEEDQLPLKYAGFSQCYRSEIGSHGRDTKGLYRVHEFMKIEQVVFCKGTYEESEKMHQEMLGYAEELLHNLKLPYRVIQLCTGDMGAGKYKMFDVETWMPSRNAYGETHSASNLGDWQTRRLNVKVKDKDGNKYYPHALNNTVVASPRVLIAIWENYQNADGSIRVPEVLVPYMGTELIKKKD